MNKGDDVAWSPNFLFISWSLFLQTSACIPVKEVIPYDFLLLIFGVELHWNTMVYVDALSTRGQQIMFLFCERSNFSVICVRGSKLNLRHWFRLTFSKCVTFQRWFILLMHFSFEVWCAVGRPILSLTNTYTQWFLMLVTKIFRCALPPTNAILSAILMCIIFCKYRLTR